MAFDGFNQLKQFTMYVNDFDFPILENKGVCSEEKKEKKSSFLLACSYQLNDGLSFI